MQIDVRNLTYIYNEKSKDFAVKAVDDVSLSIGEGIFGVIGHTGSGKSTFIQHLNGLIKVQKNRGKITVGEFDLTDKKCNFKKLRAKVGMVFQYPEYQLFAETVRDDVAFALKNFYPDLSEEEKEQRIKTAIETVGLNYEKVKDRSPFELSGGNKRRVAIAGVIVASPEVLVLDEPVAGLDPKGKNEFMSLIKELRKNVVKTVVIVSHDMNLIAEYCDGAAVFSHGKIYKTGTPEEVFDDAGDVLGLGLELPLVIKLKNALKDKGVDIKCGVSEESFINAAADIFGGGKTK